MHPESWIIRISERVDAALEHSATETPLAAAAAVATLYLDHRCRAPEALAYLALLAEATGESAARLGVVCGSVLRAAGEENPLAFVAPS